MEEKSCIRADTKVDKSDQMLGITDGKPNVAGGRFSETLNEKSYRTSNAELGGITGKLNTVEEFPQVCNLSPRDDNKSGGNDDVLLDSEQKCIRQHLIYLDSCSGKPNALAPAESLVSPDGTSMQGLSIVGSKKVTALCDKIRAKFATLKPTEEKETDCKENGEISEAISVGKEASYFLYVPNSNAASMDESLRMLPSSVNRSAKDDNLKPAEAKEQFLKPIKATLQKKVGYLVELQHPSQIPHDNSVQYKDSNNADKSTVNTQSCTDESKLKNGKHCLADSLSKGEVVSCVDVNYANHKIVIKPIEDKAVKDKLSESIQNLIKVSSTQHLINGGKCFLLGGKDQKDVSKEPDASNRSLNHVVNANGKDKNIISNKDTIEKSVFRQKDGILLQPKKGSVEIGSKVIIAKPSLDINGGAKYSDKKNNWTTKIPAVAADKGENGLKNEIKTSSKLYGPIAWSAQNASLRKFRLRHKSDGKNGNYSKMSYKIQTTESAKQLTDLVSNGDHSKVDDALLNCCFSLEREGAAEGCEENGVIMLKISGSQVINKNSLNKSMSKECERTKKKTDKCTIDRDFVLGLNKKDSANDGDSISIVKQGTIPGTVAEERDLEYIVPQKCHLVTMDHAVQTTLCDKKKRKKIDEVTKKDASESNGHTMQITNDLLLHLNGSNSCTPANVISAPKKNHGKKRHSRSGRPCKANRVRGLFEYWKRKRGNLHGEISVNERGGIENSNNSIETDTPGCHFAYNADVALKHLKHDPSGKELNLDLKKIKIEPDEDDDSSKKDVAKCFEEAGSNMDATKSKANEVVNHANAAVPALSFPKTNTGDFGGSFSTAKDAFIEGAGFGIVSIGPELAKQVADHAENSILTSGACDSNMLSSPIRISVRESCMIESLLNNSQTTCIDLDAARRIYCMPTTTKNVSLTSTSSIFKNGLLYSSSSSEKHDSNLQNSLLHSQNDAKTGKAQRKIDKPDRDANNASSLDSRISSYFSWENIKFDKVIVGRKRKSTDSCPLKFSWEVPHSFSSRRLVHDKVAILDKLDKYHVRMQRLKTMTTYTREDSLDISKVNSKDDRKADSKDDRKVNKVKAIMKPAHLKYSTRIIEITDRRRHKKQSKLKQKRAHGLSDEQVTQLLALRAEKGITEEYACHRKHISPVCGKTKTPIKAKCKAKKDRLICEESDSVRKEDSVTEAKVRDISSSSIHPDTKNNSSAANGQSSESTGDLTECKAGSTRATKIRTKISIPKISLSCVMPSDNAQSTATNRRNAKIREKSCVEGSPCSTQKISPSCVMPTDDAQSTVTNRRSAKIRESSRVEDSPCSTQKISLSCVMPTDDAQSTATNRRNAKIRENSRTGDSPCSTPKNSLSCVITNDNAQSTVTKRRVSERHKRKLEMNYVGDNNSKELDCKRRNNCNSTPQNHLIENKDDRKHATLRTKKVKTELAEWSPCSEKEANYKDDTLETLTDGISSELVDGLNYERLKEEAVDSTGNCLSTTELRMKQTRVKLEDFVEACSNQGENKSGPSGRPIDGLSCKALKDQATENGAKRVKSINLRKKQTRVKSKADPLERCSNREKKTNTRSCTGNRNAGSPPDESENGLNDDEIPKSITENTSSELKPAKLSLKRTLRVTEAKYAVDNDTVDDKVEIGSESVKSKQKEQKYSESKKAVRVSEVIRNDRRRSRRVKERLSKDNIESPNSDALDNTKSLQLDKTEKSVSALRGEQRSPSGTALKSNVIENNQSYQGDEKEKPLCVLLGEKGLLSNVHGSLSSLLMSVSGFLEATCPTSDTFCCQKCGKACENKRELTRHFLYHLIDEAVDKNIDSECSNTVTTKQNVDKLKNNKTPCPTSDKLSEQDHKSPVKQEDTTSCNEDLVDKVTYKANFWKLETPVNSPNLYSSKNSDNIWTPVHFKVPVKPVKWKCLGCTRNFRSIHEVKVHSDRCKLDSPDNSASSG